MPAHSFLKTVVISGLMFLFILARKCRALVKPAISGITILCVGGAGVVAGSLPQKAQTEEVRYVIAGPDPVANADAMAAAYEIHLLGETGTVYMSPGHYHPYLTVKSSFPCRENIRYEGGWKGGLEGEVPFPLDQSDDSLPTTGTLFHV